MMVNIESIRQFIAERYTMAEPLQCENVHVVSFQSSLENLHFCRDPREQAEMLNQIINAAEHSLSDQLRRLLATGQKLVVQQGAQLLHEDGDFYPVLLFRLRVGCDGVLLADYREAIAKCQEMELDQPPDWRPDHDVPEDYYAR